MATSTIECYDDFVPVIQNDTQMLEMLKKSKNKMKLFVVLDTSKNMKILQTLNLTYCWLIVGESGLIWSDHPEFLAFTEGRLEVGQFNVDTNDYSVRAHHRASLT